MQFYFDIFWTFSIFYRFWLVLSHFWWLNDVLDGSPHDVLPRDMTSLCHLANLKGNMFARTIYPLSFIIIA